MPSFNAFLIHRLNSTFAESGMVSCCFLFRASMKTGIDISGKNMLSDSLILLLKENCKRSETAAACDSSSIISREDIQLSSRAFNFGNNRLIISRRKKKKKISRRPCALMRNPNHVRERTGALIGCNSSWSVLKFLRPCQVRSTASAGPISRFHLYRGDISRSRISQTGIRNSRISRNGEYQRRRPT